MGYWSVGVLECWSLLTVMEIGMMETQTCGALLVISTAGRNLSPVWQSGALGLEKDSSRSFGMTECDIRF